MSQNNIAIAGSYGRTLARCMIEHVLPKADASITDLEHVHQGFAKRIGKYLHANMLILTHAASEQLDVFFTVQTVAHEYLDLAQGLPKATTVILNIDDDQLRNILPRISAKTISYGMQQSSDVRLTRMVRKNATEGLFIELVVSNKHYEAYMPNLFAQEHAFAVLSAIAVVYANGGDVQASLASLCTFELPEGVLRKIPGMQGCLVIEEERGACPEQIVQSLQHLESFTAKNSRRIIIVGDLEHLGDSAPAWHEDIGRAAAASATMILFVGKLMRGAQTAVLQVSRAVDTHHFLDSDEAAQWLPEHIKKGDCVYIAGGSSMNMSVITKRLTREE